MNLPNKLTLLRIVMIPLFLIFFLIDTIPLSYLWALIVFALACITDALDGRIARKHGLITDFGKLMDPLADKLLVMSAMVAFIPVMGIPAVVPIIILSREFLVTSMRLVAAGSGRVIAADIFGKIKTVTQMCWLIYGMAFRCIIEYFMRIDPLTYLPGPAAGAYPVMSAIFQLLMWLSVAATLVSGFNYIWKNRELFSNTK